MGGGGVGDMPAECFWVEGRRSPRCWALTEDLVRVEAAELVVIHLRREACGVMTAGEEGEKPDGENADGELMLP